MNKDSEELLEAAQARLERRRRKLREAMPDEVGQVLDKIVRQIRAREAGDDPPKTPDTDD